MSSQLSPPRELAYPESDGQPMADNTLQWEWIATIKGGVEVVFADNPDVFVAGDLLWYPEEGNNKLRVAPDVLVAFGRPSGHRRSYLQWKEGNIAPQVVFEILSQNNRGPELVRKFRFYDQYGVEEYYIYDPEEGNLSGWIRRDGVLSEISEMRGWVSPRLGVRFELENGELRLFDAAGKPFATYLELHQRADRERERADHEHVRAEQERERADDERLRAKRLAAQLNSLGIKPQE